MRVLGSDLRSPETVHDVAGALQDVLRTVQHRPLMAKAAGNPRVDTFVVSKLQVNRKIMVALQS